MIDEASRSERSAVACPFCGLACDDLVMRIGNGQVDVVGNGCARSIAFFRTTTSAEEYRPTVQGRAAALGEATSAAARILEGARQPVIGGLGTDVAGARAAMQLADRVGAVVDHMNQGVVRNSAVVHDSGWLTTTFAEVQNRADLVIIAGSDVTKRFPRFFERILGARESMFTGGVPKREIIYIGGKPGDAEGAAGRVIPCSDLGATFGALRAIIAGKRLQAEQAGGVAMAELADLAQRMREASYGVLVWVAADLDQPHAELAIQSMSTLVADLNAHTRFAGLPISGTDGDMTVNQVALWQTGFTFRTGFGRGVPDYDPYHHACNRMLENGEADALLWISAYDAARVPPSCGAPTVVLGRAGMRFDRPPAIYIPVATPGIHHAGHFFRGDNVVAVRLRKLVDSPLPAVADVLGRIEAALRG